MTEPTNHEPQQKSALWLVLRVFDEPVQVFENWLHAPVSCFPRSCLSL